MKINTKLYFNTRFYLLRVFINSFFKRSYSKKNSDNYITLKYTHIKILGMIFFSFARDFPEEISELQKCLVHNNKWGVHWVC